jgi:DNA-binding transcriptional ArsR family regulator
VNDQGRAKGDTSLADLQRRAQHAGSILAKRAVLDAINAEIDSVKVARRVGWADRGIEEGRFMIARYALVHGQKRAALAFDVSQPTVSRYVKELRQKEAKA